MEENITEGEEPEHDIIQLLNTKKKNREILTVTNAAVDALTARQHPQTKNPLNSQEYNIYEEVQEYGDVNDSFVSSSSKEGSFNGRHRVRISSRLLREIKPPLHRSNSTNEKSSSEKGNTSSSNLFSSQCSSKYYKYRV